ncbi:MAG: ribosomal-processing cysteine protease Prp [Firmicutes bacterium]|jgi:uncharacterized protein YsxB (DUF464 family)|nr:ribosomal-processing cysteine protease Prp [Bacillota bacterium]
MTKVIIKLESDAIVGINISGHADYDEHGYDIVCSGISVLGQTAIVSLYEVAHIEDLVYEIQDGYIDIKLPIDINEEKLGTSQIIFKTIIRGLEGIKEAYPEYIEVYEEEVQGYVKI